MDSKITEQTTVDDIAANPTAFGAPTFQEFAKNPDRFRKRKDHLFEIADRGSQYLGKVIQRHIYYMDGVKCLSAEHAQRVMLDKGINPDNLEMKIGLENIGGQQAIAHIHYRRKTNLILPGEF